MILAYITTVSFALLLFSGSTDGSNGSEDIVWVKCCIGVQTDCEEPFHDAMKELKDIFIKDLKIRASEGDRALKCYGLQFHMPIPRSLIELGKKEIEKLQEQKRKERRSYQDNRWVEIGPGAYKSELIDYPAKTFQSDLKKLLAIKARKEKAMENLNKE